MTDKSWLVPDVINPAENVCVQLEIPNDIKHIAAFWGALRELEHAWNWEDGYVTGLQTALVWRDIIEQASQQVRTGVNCMLDCADVEDCLDTSTIINLIEGDIIINSGDIVNNTNDIVNNTTNVTEIINNPPDGNVYADEPTAETDPACGAAYYIVAQVRAFLEAHGMLSATTP